MGGAITVSSFVVLSLLSGADYLQAFEPRQLQALARLFIGAQSSGYWIMLVFFGLGSTTYSYLLVRSCYVPKALAVFGVVASALGVLFILASVPGFPRGGGGGRPGAAGRRAGVARDNLRADLQLRVYPRPLAAREGVSVPEPT